ncbi:TPA: metallophosphoesterase [Pseudomonas aeruginosa]|nr:metallophosphoesterase [Pseudomonas aeruginosa]
MTLVQRFERNTAGRDFCVGDVHGCFGLLDALLAQAAFDKAVDRLFSVGDLVDRGPGSDLVQEWLSQPWFHAVRGNHEQMVVDTYKHGGDDWLHVANGGAWLLGLPETEQRGYAELFDDLPLAIEVETAAGAVGIVHAECQAKSWQAFCAGVEAGEKAHVTAALWARSRAANEDSTPVEGVAAVLVGHTPHNRLTRLGNVFYLDTGACFGGSLSMLCLNDWSVSSARGTR